MSGANLKFHKRELYRITDALECLDRQLGNLLFNKLSLGEGTYTLENIISSRQKWKKYVESLDDKERNHITQRFQGELRRIDDLIAKVVKRLRKKAAKARSEFDDACAAQPEASPGENNRASKRPSPSSSDPQKPPPTSVIDPVSERPSPPPSDPQQPPPTSVTGPGSKRPSPPRLDPQKPPPTSAVDPIGYVRGFRETVRIQRTIDGIFRMVTLTPNLSGYANKKMKFTWSFVLDVHDDQGRHWFSIPVTMAGGGLSGVVAEGDLVKAIGAWSRGETLKTAQLENLTTRTRVRARGLAKRL